MPLSARLPEPGELLLGKYRVARMLGRGGVGVVYEAEHLRLRQRVAVKFLMPEMLAHAEMVERFEREARAMALIASPHVTRVIDVDVTGEGLPFLVMEFLDGHDLHSELRARGTLTVAEAAHWLRQACAGMAAVHAAGIVHRDLKPANLFLADTPQDRTLKIMDFGISKISGEDLDVTMTVTTLGTPAYMAPEQVRSAKHIDGRADVWSLGVILYRALAGQLPFQGGGATAVAVAIVNEHPQPIEALRPDVPPGLAAIVRRALAKLPDERFPSVQAMSDALAPFDNAAYATSPAAAPPASAVEADPSLAAHAGLPLAAHVGLPHGRPLTGRAMRVGVATLLGAVAVVIGVLLVRRAPMEAAGESDGAGALRPSSAAGTAKEPSTTPPPGDKAASATEHVEEIESLDPEPVTTPSASPSVTPPAPTATTPKPPAPKATPTPPVAAPTGAQPGPGPKPESKPESKPRPAPGSTALPDFL